ncbi:rhodanese-like domain-containing protein [Candidatus Marinimicrobia bacterium]|nr:rhodanese-like domain-containing protein [Candidatus Neomarinimicrobiota bacterium]|tara:strand:- start:879 stop:1373 length:495 start_codon:yes stop_codon:yes gene_type:complete
MIKFHKLYAQVVLILFASVFTSLLFNQLRNNSLPFVKKKVEVVSVLKSTSSKNSEPSIIGIDLELAKKLFEENTLFVDARAEEFYNEGHIPNAICFDDFDLLIEKLENTIGMDDQFIVYCSDSDCGSSEDLSYELQSYGYNNILLFKGGWKEWTGANLNQIKNE